MFKFYYYGRKFGYYFFHSFRSMWKINWQEMMSFPKQPHSLVMEAVRFHLKSTWTVMVMHIIRFLKKAGAVTISATALPYRKPGGAVFSINVRFQ